MCDYSNLQYQVVTNAPQECYAQIESKALPQKAVSDPI